MKSQKTTDSESTSVPSVLSCGIVMPISPIDGCSAEHWAEVKQIIQDAVDTIEQPKFTAKLVSDADDIGVIQKRIVQGVYNSDIIVCDVSGKNSNVMFELGMRLAFDKPTVIIKDDKTDYSFDTSIIEHIGYPRDLRFSKIVSFKKNLAEKIAATYSSSRSNPNHSTFLKSFGTFKVAHLSQTEAPSEQVMMEMLSEMQRDISILRRQPARLRVPEIPESRVSSIVTALLDLLSKEPQLVLEPNEYLINKLTKNYPKIAYEFSTKASFVESLTQACDRVKIIFDKS